METRFDVECGMGGISKGVSLFVPPAFVGRLGFGLLLADLGIVWRLFGGPFKQPKQDVTSEEVATIKSLLSVCGTRTAEKSGNDVTRAVGAPPRVKRQPTGREATIPPESFHLCHPVTTFQAACTGARTIT